MDLLSEAVSYYKTLLSEETTQLIAQANMDLYNGPHSEEGYPGFTTACKTIAQELRDVVPSCVYVSYNDPSFWSEEDEYTTFDRSDVLRRIIGRELAHYVR